MFGLIYYFNLKILVYNFIYYYLLIHSQNTENFGRLEL